MGAAERGFVITYEFDDDDERLLVIEDDGRVCHARMTRRNRKIVSQVWLYNRVSPEEQTGSESSSAPDLPLNPRTHAFDWGNEPFPSSDADFRALFSHPIAQRAVFAILIREQLFAILPSWEATGMSRLAKEDGELALCLIRSDESYWRVVAPYWKRVDIYSGADVFLRTFAQAPEAAGHLLAAHWCQSEVCNGGFHQFFSNSTGVLAPEAARGFRVIGLPAVEEIVTEAMAKFGAPYPREREQRRAFLKSIPGQTRAEWNRFIALDDAFFAATREDAFRKAADRYAAWIMPPRPECPPIPEPHAEGRARFKRLEGSRPSQK